LGTIIPPLLPTVFVVSVGISANRLHEKRISCTHPDDILVAGKVDTAFFDKTGTLTKQGMDLISVECDKLVHDQVTVGMAVCHTLSTSNSGDIVGNQVDKVSFESTGATLYSKHGEPPRILLNGAEYTVLKQFEFDCRLATQSVVVQDSNGVMTIIVKGSPEAMKTICEPSTLPDGFDATINESAKSGIYQIAMGWRAFDLDKSLAEIHRNDIEKSVSYGALINFQNLLREEATGVLDELAEGDVSTAMITGDSVLTGICIARKSGMIKPNRSVVLGRTVSETEMEWVDFDSDAIVAAPSLEALASSKTDSDLAITGKAWTMLVESDPKYASMIAKYIRVFGRCKPEDKVSVVANFVANGYKTLMCGDGQNDCGSLKTAHVGIALSSAEASVVSPFTSLDKTLTSVSEVLREGRCALASSLAAYSYYIIYGQTESFLQVINAYLSVTFTEWCWVFLDGIWSVSMAFSLPLAKSANRLTPRRPTDSLLGPETLMSVCGILSWNFLYLMIAMVTLFHQDWFQCRKWNSDDVSNVLTIGDNYESSVLFIVGGSQYISSAMVLNFGYTFRQGWWRNYVFVVLSITWLVFIFVMTIYPSSFSCIWRVNCDNEVSVHSAESAMFFVHRGPNTFSTRMTRMRFDG
jgi:predicted P-type ATPase